METKTIPTTVYAELSPNPATMKFVVNKLLIEGSGTVEYTDPDESTNSPLATRLFNFPFVTGIFISQNFITVTKNEIIEWDDVVLELREYIQEYLNTDNPVFTTPLTENTDENNSSVTEGSYKPQEPTTDLEHKIVEVLEEYITPAVARDGGAIHFHAFKDGQLSVVLKGACSGCPSSTMTLKNGIETLMTRMVPEVKEVVAHEG
ncbi:MAG: NifU N-terminal domain-containing protein [Flavobacteriales bacterium]|nr:NifU N-terminal domain-containing protein [Flavobacteriales bacterium]